MQEEKFTKYNAYSGCNVCLYISLVVWYAKAIEFLDTI